MAHQENSLAKELKKLVNKTITLLGEVILEEGGQKLFKSVETIRKDMVSYRRASLVKRQDILQVLYQQLETKNKEQQHQVAQAFTLMLELINTCESSYRTFRLKESKAVLNLKKQNNTLVYVLTAHPTEARTTQNIDLFHRIQDIAVRILEKSGEEKYLLSIIKHNLKLAWLLPITRHKKPEVTDEANHLFSIILRPDIFDTLLRANRDLGTIRVRTWVGGDKDGHPGVDEKVMIACLQASRQHFCSLINQILTQLETDIQYVQKAELDQGLKSFRQQLKEIQKIKQDDSIRVREIKKFLLKFSKNYQKLVGAENPRLRKLQSIIELFPGLVIPIELREDSEIIANALNSERPLAIERMLCALGKLAGGGKIRCYAQGMIISMCESYEDITNTSKLLKKTLGGIALPIIPLFETDKALRDSPTIIKKLLTNKEFTHQISKNWDNHLEVMLGYSDSSKGMGVLASRLGIAQTMRALDLIITEEKITPVFFHGSGGSVDRGGGSLKEQTAWWPKSALQLYKATIQGEMVERNFSSPEIILSGMDKILTNLDKVKSREGIIKLNKEVKRFADMVGQSYQTKIKEPDFFKMVETATPYSYLNVLKLGSRPSKRSKAATLDFRSIRAIPWVLCWTQTRTLFPTWWGVGSAWKEYKKDENRKECLQQAYKKSYLFSSFIRVLAFTLSKVDLQVFRLYISKSNLNIEEQEKNYQEFQQEYQLACQLVFFLSNEKSLMWFRPWLQDSITLRSSMIHPLNILQIIGNNKGDFDLVRKTTAGISSGMMTTG
jgi:phosphoenolpyruvate carboxylase